MLIFKLEGWKLIYKDQEIDYTITNGMICHGIIDNVDEINEEIVNYFDNNDFARLIAKISPSYLDDSNIITMISFLMKVNEIKKEIEKIIKAYSDTYTLVLAARSEFKDESFKMFCLTKAEYTTPELQSILYNQAPNWFSGYEVETCIINSVDDFLEEIRK